MKLFFIGRLVRNLIDVFFLRGKIIPQLFTYKPDSFKKSLPEFILTKPLLHYITDVIPEILADLLVYALVAVN